MSLNAAGFLGPLSAARSALGGVIGPLVALTGGVLSLGAAFALLKSSVGAAANVENIEGSFTTLLGSVSAAKQRIQELSDFAATTPFELNGIAQASRLLQAFTGPALSTGAGLRLVGDAAAAVGQPLEAVSMWFGRLYSGLKDGQPLGEPIQNLTQLGLISSEARKQLMAMQGTAMDAAAVMQVLSQVFGGNVGAMARLAATYDGKLSTMRDNWTALKVALGAPIRDAIKPFIDQISAKLQDLVPLAKTVGGRVAQAFALVGNEIAAGTWPQLIGDALKLGFMKAGNWLLGSIQTAGSALRTVTETVFANNFFTGLAAAFVGVATSFGTALIDAVGGKLLMGLRASVEDALDIANNVRGKRANREARDTVASEEAATGAKLTQARIDDIFAKSQDKHGYLTPEKRVEKLMADWSMGVKTIIADYRELATGGMVMLRDSSVEAAKKLAGMDLTVKPANFFNTAALEQSLAASLAAAGKNAAAVAEVEDKQAPAAIAPGASMLGGLSEIAGDRLARIGGFIGASGGPAVDYQRRTATATEKTFGAIKELINKMPIDDRPSVAAYA